MQIVKTETGFVQHYNSEVFKSIECNCETGQCKLTFCNGQTTYIHSSCSIFNMQYGIPISPKHMKLFVTDWERGLFCYDVDSGVQIWHHKDEKLTKAFVYKDYLIVHKYCKSIQKIDIVTGSVIDCLNDSSIEVIFDVQDMLIFVSKIGRVSCLFDTDNFNVVKKYPAKLTNPKDCLSQVFLSANVSGNSLSIEGFEQYANRQYGADDKTFFNRIIDNNIL